MNLDARVFKGRHGPGNDRRFLVSSFRLNFERIHQAAKIRRERRITLRVGNDFRRDLLAQRLARRGARLHIRLRRIADARQGVGL